jgi:CHAD domain-containing protein
MAANSAKAVQKAARRAADDGDIHKVAAAAAGAAAVAAGAKVAKRRSRSRVYRVKPGETLPEGLRRAALGRIEHAIDELRGKTSETPDEAVHEARKDMKKLRSILRLARSELGDELYRSENETYRDAARELSSVRDAQVMIATLDELREGAKKKLSESEVTALRREFVKRREALEADSGGRADAAKNVIEVLRESRARVREWPLESEGFDAVEPGLRRAYRGGWRAFRAVADDPSIENLHEWRKRVKDLWYHQQLLVFVNPELMEPAADGAHHLSNLLGDDHDLAVLGEAADELAKPAARPALHKAIDRRRNELQSEAFKLGRRIYKEKPRAFTGRVGRWFEQAAQSP